MIVWINGAFGAGKTTLATELHRRLPDALAFDPEYVGYVLLTWVPPAPSGDFQDIPLWRTLVAQFATEARAFRLGNVERCVAARAGLEPDALVLRGDRRPPERLADNVLSALS